MTIREASLLMALGAIVTTIAGCSAPMGPIGGSHYAGCCTLKCCHFGATSTCEEDDPTIVRPHSNFHPLPTRPVFSPPESIPGVYSPWPGENPIPPREVPFEPLEVQASPHSIDDAPAPPRVALAAGANPSGAAARGLTLRR
jgi:hypothetical protein